MSDSIIARRYAQALREEASRRGITEQTDADVALIRESIDASRELRRVFSSPIISREKKATLVRSLFEDRVGAETLRFLLLMVQKRREDIFPQVGEAYAALRDDEMGIRNVSVRVARPLEEGQEKDLQRAIEDLIGLRARLDVRLDPALIGGVVVRIGDTLYDGSVSNQLQSLRERLETGRLQTNHE